jgi:glycosyltransferase involved in cell wall biosynthesis
LIISDNASTDSTESICREYSKRDQRIQYFRNERNMGAVWNFNRVLELSKGKYFMWAAHDDIYLPGFISRCANALETTPAAALAFSAMTWIDELGRLEPADDQYVETVGLNVVRRLHLSIFMMGPPLVYSLIRRTALQDNIRFREVWGGDAVVVIELALRGGFCKIADPLYLRRRNAPLDPVSIMKVLQPDAKVTRFHFVQTRLALEEIKAVFRSRESLLSKVPLAIYVLYCLHRSGISPLADFRYWRRRGTGKIISCFHVDKPRPAS